MTEHLNKTNTFTTALYNVLEYNADVSVTDVHVNMTG